MSPTKVQQLQLLQQNIENLALQKQQFSSQLTELDCALGNLSNTSQSYRIIGKLMIATSSVSLQKELEEKHDILRLRLENVEKQEENLTKNMEQVQKDVVAELRKK
ncbi:prefoldin subunit [Candidatus Woesearchaeota archaeon]|nr:prefoldin subunit [Candidatus Woesearchaeota archaeon]